MSMKSEAVGDFLTEPQVGDRIRYLGITYEILRDCGSYWEVRIHPWDLVVYQFRKTTLPVADLIRKTKP